MIKMGFLWSLELGIAKAVEWDQLSRIISALDTESQIIKVELLNRREILVLYY